MWVHVHNYLHDFMCVKIFLHGKDHQSISNPPIDHSPRLSTGRDTKKGVSCSKSAPHSMDKRSGGGDQKRHKIQVCVSHQRFRADSGHFKNRVHQQEVLFILVVVFRAARDSSLIPSPEESDHWKSWSQGDHPQRLSGSLVQFNSWLLKMLLL